MPYDMERKDEEALDFMQEMEKAEAERLDTINRLGIVYADFDKKVLVGKCKAKDFRR